MQEWNGPNVLRICICGWLADCNKKLAFETDLAARGALRWLADGLANLVAHRTITLPLALGVAVILPAQQTHKK